MAAHKHAVPARSTRRTGAVNPAIFKVLIAIRAKQIRTTYGRGRARIKHHLSQDESVLYADGWKVQTSTSANQSSPTFQQTRPDMSNYLTRPHYSFDTPLSVKVPVSSFHKCPYRVSIEHIVRRLLLSILIHHHTALSSWVMLDCRYSLRF